MMNRKLRQAEGRGFYKDNDCYIHVEMMDGKNCEAVISGGLQGVTIGTYSLIKGICNASGKTFEEFVEELKGLHERNKE